MPYTVPGIAMTPVVQNWHVSEHGSTAPNIPLPIRNVDGISYPGVGCNCAGTLAITRLSSALTALVPAASLVCAGSTAYDYVYVEVRSTTFILLSTVATYSNKNKTTAASYSLKSFSIAAYKEQTVRV